jgi:hypothetical protein
VDLLADLENGAGRTNIDGKGDEDHDPTQRIQSKAMHFAIIRMGFLGSMAK